MEVIASIISNALDYGKTVPWLALYKTARIILIILDAVLATGFFIVLGKAWRFRPRFADVSVRPKLKDTPTFANDAYEKEWALIMKRAEPSTPDALRLAVIAADSLVDAILKDLEIEGEHMADRLEKLDAHQLTSLNNLWRAHRARNQLVHEPGFQLHESDAKRYLKYYEDFIKEIGVL